jgi:hypothetical protein
VKRLVKIAEDVMLISLAALILAGAIVVWRGLAVLVWEGLK